MSLPVLDTGPVRPNYARGPRSLEQLKMLRISVTDRCNLRCVYCMPEDGMIFDDRADHLSPEAIEEVVKVAIDLGVTHIKLTGGEPTIRKDLTEIVERISNLGIHDLSMTTNGLQLPRLAPALRDAGLQRVTISLDSLCKDRYRAITRGGNIEKLWQGVHAAEEYFSRLKFNVVVIRGMNEDEVENFAALTIEHDWTIRFIEYMPLGDSAFTAQGVSDPLVTAVETKERIQRSLGTLIPENRRQEAGVGPAEVFSLPDAKGRIGFIHAMSQPFCEQCNRLRLTARGELRSCLFDGGEIELAHALVPQPNPAAIHDAFAACILMKPEVHSQRGNRAMSQLGG